VKIELNEGIKVERTRWNVHEGKSVRESRGENRTVEMSFKKQENRRRNQIIRTNTVIN